jgi:hypothetical protein
MRAPIESGAGRRVGKRTLSNSPQRLARCQGQRHPLHEVAWERQKTPAKTRVANAVWKCETVPEKSEGMTAFVEFLTDCDAD